MLLLVFILLIERKVC